MIYFQFGRERSELGIGIEINHHKMAQLLIFYVPFDKIKGIATK